MQDPQSSVSVSFSALTHMLSVPSSLYLLFCHLCVFDASHCQGVHTLHDPRRHAFTGSNAFFLGVANRAPAYVTYTHRS
jgi:hypothetical protein